MSIQILFPCLNMVLNVSASDRLRLPHKCKKMGKRKSKVYIVFIFVANTMSPIHSELQGYWSTMFFSSLKLN